MSKVIRDGVQPPQLLQDFHVHRAFTCGEACLDRWLQRHALANQQTGASRTYVIVTTEGAVVGFYSLAPTSLNGLLATRSLRRNAPASIPMYLLGRLAVDLSWNGRGLGIAMLVDAHARAQEAAHAVGGKALMCHAIDDHAKAFYIRQGWMPSPAEPLVLMLPLRPPTALLPPSS